MIKNKISFLDLCHNRKQKKMFRTLEKDYIDSLNDFPLIPPVAYEKMRVYRFLEFYPDFEQKTKIHLSRREKQCLSICDCDDYLIDAAIKFSEDRRDEIRQFFWNIDFGNIFCLNSSEITAISLMKPNPKILRLLYSQKVSVKKTSQGYASMAIFLMNRFTQHFQDYQFRVKKKIIEMISRRLRTKIFLTKLPLIGQQHLPTQPFRGLRCEIEPHYINFMPFLHAYGENRIEIMLLDDLRWFSQIIQQQNLPASLSDSEPDQIGGIPPVLAQLIRALRILNAVFNFYKFLAVYILMTFYYFFYIILYYMHK